MLLLCFFTVSCTEKESIEARVLALAAVDVSEADTNVQSQIAVFQERAATEAGNAKAVGDLGVVFELHGFSAEALEAYELASALDPSSFRWTYYRGILLAARFDRTLALETIEEAIAKRPDYGPAWLHKGKVELEVAAFDQARQSFRQAETLTEDPYARLGQAMALLELDDPSAAVVLISETAELANDSNAQRLLGTALIRSGQIEKGSEILANFPYADRAHWRDPIAEEKNKYVADNFNARLIRTVNLIRAQDYESALGMLADLRIEHPNNKHVLHLLSSVYELRGHTEQAYKMLQEGIRLHPKFYVFRTALASFLKNQGQLDEAANQLDVAISIDPKVHWAYSQKALLFMEQKKWLEASQLLDQAIGLRNDDADLYTYLGICMGFLHRWPEAANLYRVALTIDPEHVPSYINLARAETILNNEEEALRALAAARKYGANPTLLASVERQRKQIKRMQIDQVGQ